MIIHRCTNICPHFAEPCEFTDDEIWSTTHTAICPIGESNNYIIPSDTDNEFFCLIVGSRSFTDYKLFSSVCDKLLVNMVKKNKQIFIVSGGAEGTDKMAERYAKEHHYPLMVMPADWNDGKKAGFIRNRKMHNFISSKESRGVLAFWDEKSNGTRHSFQLSREYENPLRIFSTKRNGFIEEVINKTKEGEDKN